MINDVVSIFSILYLWLLNTYTFFFSYVPISPVKVDALFPINQFLDFDVGKQSLFIIDYAEVKGLGANHTHFSGKQYL